MQQEALDAWQMARALELAARGRGFVEPNPLVGCTLARGAEIIAEGWHRRFGGPHAEIEALRLAGSRAHGATMYVTLEPCCHHGKTAPCTDAIIAAGVRRVVVAAGDPFPEVAGGGLAALRAAGIEVVAGIAEDEALRQNAPYRMLLKAGRPWVIGKWAMTLDGKIATRTGDSRWISSEASRAVAHAMRGRVDAVLVGRGTVERDDPLLTARPAGPRVARRVVLDSRARLPLTSRLVATAAEAPVLVACGAQAAAGRRTKLERAGCEVLVLPGDDRRARLGALLAELGRRRLTNVLVEGGGEVLGSFLDAGWLDEVHVFIAPLVIGGRDATTAVAGEGCEQISSALRLERPEVSHIEGDVYLHGTLRRG